MISRKELKTRAKKSVKKHYILFVILCLISFGIGSQFTVHNEEASSDGNTAGEMVSSILGIDQEGTFGNVVTDVINNDVDSGSQKAEEALNAYQSETDPTGKVFGHTEGVLASVVNVVASGAMVVKVAQSLNSIFHSTNAGSVILILLSIGLYAMLWFFITNTFEVAKNRMFLEGRSYDKVPLSRVLNFIAVHRWLNVAWVMFRMSVQLTLWFLTIIGGPIKAYAYRMIPYIIAENPDMKASDAIRLSRMMMKGHKWEAFILDLSFLLWDLCSLLTFTLLDHLWLNPYKEATFAEYFVEIRQLAKNATIPNADLCNDTWLYEHADQATLDSVYGDVLQEEAYLNAHAVPLTGARKFFAENFSIWLGTIAEKREYQEQCSLEYQLQREQSAAAGEQYPIRLNPLWDHKKKTLGGSIFFLRSYTIWSIIAMFFLFSFIGWLWEVSLYLIQSGVFVNRGTMFGPWLPIYGSGGVVCLILMSRFRKNPALTLVGSIVLCGILEYSSSLYLQVTYGQRWWDYTGYFLNLDGRICAEGLLVFGVGAMLIIYLIAPLNDLILSRVNKHIGIPVCVVLLVLFGIDAVHSSSHPNAGNGITNNDVGAVVSETQSI